MYKEKKENKFMEKPKKINITLKAFLIVITIVVEK